MDIKIDDPSFMPDDYYGKLRDNINGTEQSGKDKKMNIQLLRHLMQPVNGLKIIRNMMISS